MYFNEIFEKMGNIEMKAGAAVTTLDGSMAYI